jgi:hypothetical protein
MPHSIECHYTGCREIFKPRGNQRYHGAECARKGRRLKDRLRKRRRRAGQRRLQMEQAVHDQAAGPLERKPGSPVRSSPARRNFFTDATRVINRWSVPPASSMPIAAGNAA